jgi:hypothetical protein
MRIAITLCFGLFVAAGLSAQGHITGSSGSVVYPGGAPGTPGVTRTGTSVVHPGGGGVHVAPNQRGPAAVAPRAVYAYPVYIGGYGSYDQSYAAQQDSGPVQPNVTVVMPPQQQAPVIVNNYYPSAVGPNPDEAQPVTETVDATPTAEPTHYLIAFKDHTIYAATAYWVDGDTLHYFTSGNTHNQASLSLVDRDFTARLNKEAGVEVKLPAPAK